MVKMPSDLEGGKTMEFVLKCLRGTRSRHEFVENWFQSRFDLPRETVETTLTAVKR